MLNMIEIIVLLLVLTLILLAWLAWREFSSSKNSAQLNQLEDKHRLMLLDLNDGLNKLADRLNVVSQDNSDRLKTQVSLELQSTRNAMQELQLAQNTSLALTRETVLETLHKTLSEQGREQQSLINNTMLKATTTLTQSVESLGKIVDNRLEQIGGKVSERLDEGFKKTNETFISVMERLATIDEAQKKIDGLTVNMVSLQE